MIENIQMSLTEASMRKLLDFRRGEFVTLGTLSKVLGKLPKTLESWSKQEKPAFPPIQQFGDFGWRQVSRNDLLNWFKASGVKNVEDYATFKQRYYSTRELGDECGLRPEKVLDYVSRGIVKPLDTNTGHKQYMVSEVEKLKAYLVEQRTKEDKARADAKQKFNDGMKAAYDKMGANQKNKEEQAAEIEARRKASIESEVDNYRKSISGGTR